MLPTWAIILIVFAVLIVLIAAILVSWVISVYNSLVKLRNNVREAFSTMDVSMKKRYDLIPNLVETVKGYAKHESETLENVMKARASCLSSTSTAERAENENGLSKTLSRLLAVTENYPQLKANQNFINLQSELSSIEDEISEARKYYNGCVEIFNNKVECFPTNLIAKKFNFEFCQSFQIENKEERKVPQVKF